MVPEEGRGNLQEMLDQLEEGAQGAASVSLDGLLDHVGRRSYGPILLLAGLIILAPLIGDIPGVPTVLAALVFLISGQLLFGRRHFWVPGWLGRRTVSSDKLRAALRRLRRPTRFVDRVLRPRLTVLAGEAASRVIALMCLMVAASTPLLEMIPFSANLAGAALTAFGLALVTRDGFLALIAFAFVGSLAGVLFYSWP